MKKQKFMNNAGYSMVELIIVIAIIGILTAVSLVTWRSVDSAKYKKSVSTLESELTTLRTTTMAQDERMAMMLFYNDLDGSYYVVRGIWAKLDGDTEYRFHLADDLPDTDSLKELTYYDYVGTSNPVKIMKGGTINYSYFSQTKKISEGTASVTVTRDERGRVVGVSTSSSGGNAKGVVIAFNKSDGSLYLPGEALEKVSSTGDVEEAKYVSFNVIKKNDETVANVKIHVQTGTFRETY